MNKQELLKRFEGENIKNTKEENTGKTPVVFLWTKCSPT